MNEVRKLFPVELYDIPETETYLSDMAAQGLHFKKLGLLAHFEQGEPQTVAYRLEPVRAAAPPPEEMLVLYREGGWDYVTVLGSSFYLFRSNRADPVEIHTDPVAQSLTFQHLERRLKWSLAGAAIVTGCLLMILYVWLGNGHSVRYLVENGHLSYLALMLLYCWFLWGFTLRWRSRLRLLSGALRAGHPMTHRKHYRSTAYPTALFSAAIFVLAALELVTSFTSLTGGREYPLADYGGSLPTVRLAALESDSRLEPEVYLDGGGLDRNNRVTFSKSDLARGIYEIEESGLIPGEVWSDGSGPYTPRLYTVVYDLRPGFLAEGLMKDLLDDALEFYRYRPTTYQELLESPFEQGILVLCVDTQFFSGICGDKVVFVQYTGRGDLESQLPALYAAVDPL